MQRSCAPALCLRPGPKVCRVFIARGVMYIYAVFTMVGVHGMHSTRRNIQLSMLSRLQ